jgi:hypothetical protein
MEVACCYVLRNRDLVQMKDRDKELQMRGKKGQSIEEVANLIWEYEDDITVKTHKLKEILVCHPILKLLVWQMLF